jgi:AraC-like DNA-binding protein
MSTDVGLADHPKSAADEIQLRSVMLGLIAALGVDVGRMLRLAGVSPSRFASSKAGVAFESYAMKAGLTIREFFALWQALGDVADTPDIGLRLGAETHQLNLFLAALQAPDLERALKKFARYNPACCGETVQVHVDVDKDEARIDFHWLHFDVKVPVTAVDTTLATVFALARRGTARPLTPRRIELARRRSDEAMLKRHFACDIAFDTPVDRLVFDRTALARPFVTQNDHLSAVMLPGLEAALYASQRSRSLADDVRYVLRRHILGQRPSVEQVALEMHMSPRTLQRRLAELGTSYQKLLDDVRDNTARRLLLDTDLNVGEIASVLGFDEVTSFVRAFHAWEGEPPWRWRECQQTAP